MAAVRKGNTLLFIADELIPEYLQRGYDIADKGGNVITKTIPTDILALQKAYTEQEAKIAELEKQIIEGSGDSSLRTMYQELEKGHNELMETYESVEEENETLKNKIAELEKQIAAHAAAEVGHKTKSK